MHSDVHFLLHAHRSSELRREAAALRAVRPGMRHRVGWAMVELGLRLAQARPAPARAARTA
ncbi:hypothetical protein OG279_22505 [Streptomyces sp. NBC_01201]|uniref:hypothetical protein n=1 Tax=unclassified Streptomyces TaxID=2593676 RepID=UPI0011CA6A52|nr:MULTISPECIES: hypothetical protein [unclassified Streptomyces]TXS09194.1 hypothetical protein EAO68_34835 [Streptomyces sp. wa22]WSQ79570.1 hypothetical protein OG725_21820 [Streptomyces sp. NBC_01213]WSQ86950.1 hypothetical protein OG722_22500 [Streptomyces sp. NBC_01212]WSR50226.1 hypothetical protein OG279_22505 [Streptomyces sp. NBC_01201]